MLHEKPVEVYFFDLELLTGSGLILYTERQPTLYGGQPIQMQAGTELEMVWDIAIDRIPPSVVKAVKPGSIGLTSRWTDRDTGDFDATGGNMNLSPEQKTLLEKIKAGEARLKKEDAEQLASAQLRAKRVVR